MSYVDPVKAREYQRTYWAKPENKTRKKARMDVYNKSERAREAHKAKYQRYRTVVLAFYGGSPPKCACCQESREPFLTIDHVNGGGIAHRKTMRAASIYAWLYSHRPLTGFQVLCYNCNCAKGHRGACPHELEKLQ